MLEARLRTGLADYAAHLPAAERDLRVRVLGVEGTPIGHQVAFVLPYILATSVVLTLLIACANVAILMIAQWTAREHEIAIRAAIGASRGRIVRSLLTESVLVATLGGILGVCVTFALRGWIVRRGGDIQFFDLSIDPRVLVQTAVITLLTGMTAGLAPALYQTRRLQVNPLRSMAGSDRVRQRWRSALVVFEITVTVALLVVTSSMIDGYLGARRPQLGYPTRPLLSARVDNPAGVPTARILEVLENLPGVASAAAATSVPYGAIGPRVRVSADATESHAIVSERGDITAGYSRRSGCRFERVAPSPRTTRDAWPSSARRSPVSCSRAGTLSATASGSRTRLTISSGSSPTTRAIRCGPAISSPGSTSRCPSSRLRRRRASTSSFARSAIRRRSPRRFAATCATRCRGPSSPARSPSTRCSRSGGGSS